MLGAKHGGRSRLGEPGEGPGGAIAPTTVYSSYKPAEGSKRDIDNYVFFMYRQQRASVGGSDSTTTGEASSSTDPRDERKH